MGFDTRSGRISDLIAYFATYRAAAPVWSLSLRQHGVMVGGCRNGLLSYSGLCGNEGVVLAPATISQQYVEGDCAIGGTWTRSCHIRSCQARAPRLCDCYIKGLIFVSTTGDVGQGVLLQAPEKVTR